MIDELRKLRKENRELREENEQLKARITRMIVKHRALQEQVKQPTSEDGIGMLRGMFGMK
jgi:regulator of replication initiation timing